MTVPHKERRDPQEGHVTTEAQIRVRHLSPGTPASTGAKRTEGPPPPRASGRSAASDTLILESWPPDCERTKSCGFKPLCCES